uniref:Uncharacterized protein n=1 Tax=Leptobrachium leishanense TaxID=445787 RepID=A0A8C5LV22_9ANUR
MLRTEIVCCCCHCFLYSILQLLHCTIFCSVDAARASSNGSSRHLQPWLIGLTAMVTFLFIVFVLMIANRLFCKKKKCVLLQSNLIAA